MGDSSSEEETMAVCCFRKIANARAERDEHLLLSIQRRRTFQDLGRVRDSFGNILSVANKFVPFRLDVTFPIRSEQIRVCVEEICDLVVSLTECCAHAGYLLAVLQDGSTPEVPGAVDRYQLCRAAAEIEHKTGLLRTYRLHTITSLQLTDICINVTESANILTDSCLKAADEALQGNTREQFRLCLKSVAAALNTFCGSIKFLKDLPDECKYRACQVFGEALTTTCNALAVFATQDSKLTGTSAKLSPVGIDTLHDVLSACMGVVSPCVLVCSIVRDVAGHWDDKVVTRVQQCHGAVLRSSNKLTEALGGFGSEERKDNGKMWMDEDSQWPSHPSEHSTGQIVSGHRFYPQQHGDEWRGKAHVQEEFQSIVLTAISHIWGYRQLVHEVERLRTIQYDADDSSHEDKLLKLWGLLMPDVHLKSRVTKQWQEIGFQGDDPKTDFRGMGILGLENLIYFAEEYPGPAGHVLSHSHHPQYGYAFAIVGINLTFMAYHLLKDGLAKTHVYNVSKIFPDIKLVEATVASLQEKRDKNNDSFKQLFKKSENLAKEWRNQYAKNNDPANNTQLSITVNCKDGQLQKLSSPEFIDSFEDVVLQGAELYKDEVVLCISHSSLMSSNIIKPRSGEWVMTIDFIKQAAITSLFSDSNYKCWHITNFKSSGCHSPTCLPINSCHIQSRFKFSPDCFPSCLESLAIHTICAITETFPEYIKVRRGLESMFSGDLISNTHTKTRYRYNESSYNQLIIIYHFKRSRKYNTNDR
uniref:ELMO domain-containing protein n=1 Tax=Timema poppense TaxID=170557 RepID=A0A7R9H571_TIMPO|nr:unnamed protein product [Timema poppensis]